MGRREVVDLIGQCGSDVLLVPGRPGDGRYLLPGMPSLTFRDTPQPDKDTPQYTRETERTAFHYKYFGVAIIYAAIEAAAAQGMEEVGGVHIEAQADRTPFICAVINDPSRIADFEGTVHVVRTRGWEPDERSHQPNRFGHTLAEAVEWVHYQPSQVQILGSATCRLLDAEMPIANVAGIDPSQVFYWR